MLCGVAVVNGIVAAGLLMLVAGVQLLSLAFIGGWGPDAQPAPAAAIRSETEHIWVAVGIAVLAAAVVLSGSFLVYARPKPSVSLLALGFAVELSWSAYSATIYSASWIFFIPLLPAAVSTGAAWVQTFSSRAPSEPDGVVADVRIDPHQFRADLDRWIDPTA